ncbi:MAG: hypothetical protein LUE17_06720 [Planctomycetaceae bacterium]|nr:hypothetical protein [Planctomycetaceae bacterium]
MSRASFDRLAKSTTRQFGVDVLYLRNVEGRRRKRFPIRGVFDNDYEAVGFEGNGAQVMSRTLQLGIHTKALPFFPAKGDKVRIGKQMYVISEAQPDSEYVINLILKVAHREP